MKIIVLILLAFPAFAEGPKLENAEIRGNGGNTFTRHSLCREYLSACNPVGYEFFTDVEPLVQKRPGRARRWLRRAGHIVTFRWGSK